MLESCPGMPTAIKANILVVEDDVEIRTLLSVILIKSGFKVRAAEDGFSALVELRAELPDMILSDLYMPGMSGFELLSVVRRRFPTVRVVATSSAFTGSAVPEGIAADAFYEKASGLRTLLEIVEAMANPNAPPPVKHAGNESPMWIQRNGFDASEDAVTISCPECLRTFPQAFGPARFLIHEAGCVHCYQPLRYAIVHGTGPGGTSESGDSRSTQGLNRSRT